MNPKMTTTYYKVLEALFTHQVDVGYETYCPLRQDEIATILNCNRMTVNSALRELRLDDYVVFEQNKRYYLTKKGIDTVRKAMDIE